MASEQDKLASVRVGGDVEELSVTQTTGDEPFVSLHHHDTFSYMDGFGSTAEHAEAAAQYGQPALATTNHGNVTSHVMHQAKCEERGVKPVFGCELYTAPAGVRRPTDNNKLGVTQRKNHLTVLAENRTGYRNLMRLVTRSWADGFYYYPTATEEMLDETAEGLIVLSGCTASLLATSLIGGKNIDPSDAGFERATRVAEQYRDRYGDGFYLEVQAIPELPEVRQINAAYEEMSRKLGIPLVATADVHVPQPKDVPMRQTLHAIGRGAKSVEQIGQEWDYTIDCSTPRSARQVVARLMRGGMSRAAAQQAVANTVNIADRTDVKLPHMGMQKFPLPKGYDSAVEVYWDWIWEGWKRRGFDSLPEDEQRRYRERIDYESELILFKEYEDYFLIVADMTKFAKRNNIAVGPARGSAGGSLVCYLLEITEVNPMLYDHVVFERFIDKTREDLPDIDLDFDDRRRVEVFRYMTDKYGADKTGYLGTYTAFKGKNSLDDIARVNNIPPWEVDKVKNVMIERSGGDLRADATIADTVEMFEQAGEVFEEHPELWDATKLEGNIKGMGIHAAALIVAPEPLTDVCAVYAKENSKGEHVEIVSFDKHAAEKMGLLKIDVLGLSTMGMLSECCELLGWDVDDLYNIPLDDPETIKGFQRNDVDGVFQFDGWSMRMVNEQLEPENFLEVCDVNALARPGPLHNGASSEYIEVKHGRKQPRRYHPMLDEITKHTNYQIVYQEQILRICMEVGNFEWTHAAYIRKIISKKIGEQEFARQGERFYKGAEENGLTRAEAEEIWGACITAGSYAFNSSHCVAYGQLAWWCMYLKVHHPKEFFAAALNRLPDGKHEGLLRNAASHGVELLPPDPATSNRDWEPVPDRDAIRSGLVYIKGVGDKTADKIVNYREEAAARGEPVTDWDQLIEVHGIGPKTLNRIKDWVASEDPFEVFTLDKRIAKVRDAIFAGHIPAAPITHSSGDIPYAADGVDTEIVWCGMVEERNLRDLFETNFARTGVPLDPDEVKRPDLNEWVIMTCRDGEGQIHVSTNRWSYPEFKRRIWAIEPDKDLIIAKGIKLGKQNARRIYLDDLWVVRV